MSLLFNLLNTYLVLLRRRGAFEPWGTLTIPLFVKAQTDPEVPENQSSEDLYCLSIGYRPKAHHIYIIESQDEIPWYIGITQCIPCKWRCSCRNDSYRSTINISVYTFYYVGKSIIPNKFITWFLYNIQVKSPSWLQPYWYNLLYPGPRLQF